MFFVYNRKLKKEKRPPLRQYMMDGEFFIGAALGTTLTKLALRYGEKVSAAKRNHFDADVMLLISGIIHLGKSGKQIKLEKDIYNKTCNQ